MKRVWTKFFGSECDHDVTIVVRSVGVEREVCESCGHVSFSIAPNLVLTHELVVHYDEEELPKVSGL